MKWTLYSKPRDMLLAVYKPSKHNHHACRASKSRQESKRKPNEQQTLTSDSKSDLGTQQGDISRAMQKLRIQYTRGISYLNSKRKVPKSAGITPPDLIEHAEPYHLRERDMICLLH